MKAIHIFRTGKHTAINGAQLAFSEGELQAAAAAYDPALHEAPICVGHPKDDLPAYGWIKSLGFADGGLSAEPDQVDAKFAELVREGKFKKVSAAFYTPTAPNNPAPGSYYLRHVAFLGAQPPAVKGLKAVQFAETEEGVVEFADWGFGSAARLFRGLREWLIEKFGKEAADKVLPDWDINSLNDAAQPALMAAYAESTTTTKEPPTMGAEDLAAREAALKQEREQFAAQQAQFAERNAALQKQEADARIKSHGEFVDGLVKAGTLLPKDKAVVLAFMEPLRAVDATVEFGEGDDKKPLQMFEAFKSFLQAMPKQVHFGEAARDRGEPAGELSNERVAARARTYHAKQTEAGNHISFAEAVDAVHEGRDKA